MDRRDRARQERDEEMRRYREIEHDRELQRREDAYRKRQEIHDRRNQAFEASGGRPRSGAISAQEWAEVKGLYPKIWNSIVSAHGDSPDAEVTAMYVPDLLGLIVKSEYNLLKFGPVPELEQGRQDVLTGWVFFVPNDKSKAPTFRIGQKNEWTGVRDTISINPWRFADPGNVAKRYRANSANLLLRLNMFNELQERPWDYWDDTRPADQFVMLYGILTQTEWKLELGHLFNFSDVHTQAFDNDTYRYFKHHLVRTNMETGIKELPPRIATYNPRIIGYYPIEKEMTKFIDENVHLRDGELHIGPPLMWFDRDIGRRMPYDHDQLAYRLMISNEDPSVYMDTPASHLLMDVADKFKDGGIHWGAPKIRKRHALRTLKWLYNETAPVVVKFLRIWMWTHGLTLEAALGIDHLLRD